MPFPYASSVLGHTDHRHEKLVHPTSGIPIHVDFSKAVWNARDWGDGQMNHWDYKILVRYLGRSLTVLYSTGEGWKADSLDAKTVISGLISEYRPDLTTFADFVAEYGLEPDKAARKTYAAMLRQNQALKRVFTNHIDELVENWKEDENDG